MKAKISIIVPVYNVQKYLNICLDSLINQRMSDIEIICIDDASTDQSGNILDDYANQDKRLKVIHSDHNIGTLEARKRGIRQALGDYIMFVDSDDYIESNTCEELLKIMEEQNVDVVHFGTQIHAGEKVSEEMKAWIIHFLTPYEGTIRNENLIRKCFVEETFDFNITNKFWKAEVVRKAFENSETKHLVASEDRYLFFLLMYFAKSYYGTKQPYYHYNVGIGVTGGDQLTLEKFEKRCSGAQASQMVDHFLEKVGMENQYHEEEKQFANKILWDCVDCWHNKLAEQDMQQGFEILKKYFMPDEVTGAVARVYFEESQDILEKAKLRNQGNTAIYYRYLGDERMKDVIPGYISDLQLYGKKVYLYTDRNRKENCQNMNYNAEIRYLPDSDQANWDKYEERAIHLQKQLQDDEIEVLLYASPSSHIKDLDVLLATLTNVKVVEMQDERHMDLERELREKIREMEEECKNPKIMLKKFLKSIVLSLKISQ